MGRGSSRAIRDAPGDPATLRRWRAAAMDSVARFTPEAMVERTVEEYASVVSEAGAAPAD